MRHLVCKDMLPRRTPEARVEHRLRQSEAGEKGSQPFRQAVCLAVPLAVSQSVHLSCQQNRVASDLCGPPPALPCPALCCCQLRTGMLQIGFGSFRLGKVKVKVTQLQLDCQTATVANCCNRIYAACRFNFI